MICRTILGTVFPLLLYPFSLLLALLADKKRIPIVERTNLQSPGNFAHIFRRDAISEIRDNEKVPDIYEGKNRIGKEHDMVSFLEISSRGNVACIEKKSSNGAAMTNDKQWSSTWRMSAGRTFSVFCLAMLVILVKRMGKKFSDWNTYLVIFVRDTLYVCNIVTLFCWEYSPRDFCL